MAPKSNKQSYLDNLSRFDKTVEKRMFMLFTSTRLSPNGAKPQRGDRNVFNFVNPFAKSANMQIN